MTEENRELQDRNTAGLSRLAALHRLREQAYLNNCEHMLESIEGMIETEVSRLRSKDTDAEPA